MLREYTVLKGKNSTRVIMALFAVAAIFIIAWEQFHGTGFEDIVWRPHYIFTYAPAIALIIASIFRSYILYAISVGLFILHQIIAIVFLSYRDGAYTSFYLFETITEYALLAIGVALFLQVVLFFFGRADIVALTHTTMVFVIITMLLTFLPQILQTFNLKLFIPDTLHAICLGMSFLAFTRGIEKAEEQVESVEFTEVTAEG